LTLYGLKYLYIDGQTSFQARAAIVRQFSTDPTIRILIISQVAGAGLNITAASVVLFLVSSLFSPKTATQLV
jgi:SNF2 family DNA or RNA helicase